MSDMASSFRRIGVLFPLALPEPFDYRAPDDLDLAPGDIVTAPLGPYARRGVVWRVDTVSPEEERRKLKVVIGKDSDVQLPEVTRRFIDFAARYTVEPPGQFLAMVLRAREALQPSPVDVLYALGIADPGRITPARRKVLDVAGRADAPMSAPELAREAGVSTSVVIGLAEAGALARVMIVQDPPFPEPDISRRGAVLTPGQQQAAQELCTSVAANSYACVLLDGVTGSGKTEVYFEAIAAALERDCSAQVLVLLPEIALSQAVMARFEARFGVKPAQWHSDVPPKERRRVWREVQAGRARIVAGARSALFLPFANLRLIIVDEEHDGSYKQEEGVIYQARDLAVARAKLGDAVIVLASATPSLETLFNAEQGRYARIRMPARHGAAGMPQVELVDLRIDGPERDHWLSPPLLNAAAETMARGEQVLFYLNRRGFAPLTICRTCGHRMKAPDTDTWLVEHRYSGRLVCHLTGFSMPKPKACPNCGTLDSLASVGPGVERVAEEARSYFPHARLEIFSSDTAETSDDVRAVVDRMERGEIDILVGTQIVAKGHNFPRLTLVGVVDADLSLKGGDLRAGERTYQVLAQVAGRAGRADRPGLAMLQTYMPEHDALQALARGDRDGFLSIELAARADLGFPPYGRLAAAILSAPDMAMADAAARTLGAAAPDADGVNVWGPAAPPLAVVRGRHRRRFLVRADRNVDLSAFMAAWTRRVKLPSAVRLAVDIDPYSFL